MEEQFYLVWPAALAISFLAARRFAFGALAVALVARFILASRSDVVFPGGSRLSRRRVPPRAVSVQTG